MLKMLGCPTKSRCEWSLARRTGWQTGLYASHLFSYGWVGAHYSGSLEKSGNCQHSNGYVLGWRPNYSYMTLVYMVGGRDA